MGLRWDEPALPFSFGYEWLDSYDSMLGLPLWFVVVVLAAWRSRSNHQAALALVPPVFVWCCVYNLTDVFSIIIISTLGLTPDLLLRMVSVWTLSLATVWLMGDFIASRRPIGRIVWPLCMMIGVGSIGLLNYMHPFHGAGELVAFALTVIVGCFLARRFCGTRFGWGRFAGILLVCNMMLITIIWSTFMIAAVLLFAPEFINELINGAGWFLVVGALGGLGVFLLEMTFLILLILSPYQQKHIGTLLAVADDARTI